KILEEEGCAAISTSCGFLAMFQNELAAAVNIPVITSGLMQVPFVSQMLGTEQKIGILTANSETLEESHFNTNNAKIAVQGMQGTEFYNTFVLRKNPTYNIKKVESEVVLAAENLIEKNPDIGAIICEGTNFAPFNPSVNR